MSDYINGVIRKMNGGAVLIYDTSNMPPNLSLEMNGKFESISNWTLTVLIKNDFVKCDNKYPVSRYQLK